MWGRSAHDSRPTIWTFLLSLSVLDDIGKSVDSGQHDVDGLRDTNQRLADWIQKYGGQIEGGGKAGCHIFCELSTLRPYMIVFDPTVPSQDVRFEYSHIYIDSGENTLIRQISSSGF